MFNSKGQGVSSFITTSPFGKTHIHNGWDIAIANFLCLTKRFLRLMKTNH